jgi:transglutaminase-like putative cysteine protease
MTNPNLHPTSFERDLAATAAITIYSLAVAIGFARVFSGWDFLGDLALIVVLGHGVSFALRRMRVSGWITVPFVSAFLLWLLAALQYSATLTYLVPRGATWDQIDLEVGLVRDQFQTAVAPVLYGAGWATLAGFAMIVVVVMADAFAFRAEARGEALVPGGVLFVFIAALGSSRLRITVTVALIAAGIVAVVALRALHDRSRRVELTSARGPRAMVLPTAVATAVAVAVLAGFVGPRVPGADAEPLYDTRGRGGGVTEVVSPLVDIRSRLTNRGNVELFRVNADAAAYWRVTTLPEFDGRTFRLPTRALERIEGDFGPGLSQSERVVRQQIQVLALGGQLVPAAADPYQAEGASDGRPLDLRLNRDTSTLLAPDDLSAGDLFTVVSGSPDLSPDLLRAAATDAPPDQIFVELPDLPSLVGDLAAEVTSGTDNPYDAAIALQNWFRNDFDYSLDVQSGHGSNAIESFLNERIGYCEQFSATFAAMARTLGMPTRVAVGFTPGLLNDEGWYSVIGRNAHAWPEVWFDDIGWVAFEPTPGRGVPGAEAYTNVPAAQDDRPPEDVGGGGDDGQGSGLAVTPTTPSTVVPPPTTIGDGTTASTLPDGSELPSLIPDGGLAAPITNGDSGGTSTPDGGSGVPWRPLLIVVIVVGAIAAPEIARRVRARSARSHGAAERIQVAWSRARTAAELAGVVGRPSMTANEWAAATAAELPVAARPMRSLAEIVDRVDYGRPGSVDLEHVGAFGATMGHDCELWSRQVDRIAGDTLTPLQRVRHYFTDW